MTENPPLIRSIPFQFKGTASEYFKIWIVNLCLTIFTVGIYSAWAKVRTLRYFYGSTWLDNNNFSYLADPLKILKGRIIAFTALIAYFLIWEIYPEAGFWILAAGVLFFPTIMVLALSFNMNNSAYRNVRFSFARDFKNAYVIFIIPILIILGLTWLGYSLLESADFIATLENQEESGFKKEDLLPSVFMLSLLPMLPYLDYIRSRFIVDNTRYGKSDASFHTGGWSFYKIYLKAFLYFFLVGIFASILIGVFAVISGFGEASTEEQIESASGLGLISVFVFYGFSFIIMAYVRAARTNMIFNHIRFGENTFNSKLKTMPVFWLYLTNTLAVIVSVGLLIPWAQIRMAKYVADNTEFEARTLDDIEAAKQSQNGALGEELGDAFDLDIGL